MLLKFITFTYFALSFFAYGQEGNKIGKDNYLERKRELVEALKGADKLEVVIPHYTHRKKKSAKDALAVITGEKNMREFVDSLVFKKEQTGGMCACGGTYHLKLSKKGKQLATINYQHHVALRWGGKHWIGDGALTSESTDEMLAWFTKNGFKEPEQDYRADQARRKARLERADFVLSHFDKSTQAMLNLPDAINDPLNPKAISDEEKSKRLANAYDDKKELLNIAFKVVGSGAQANNRSYYEGMIIDAVELIGDIHFANYLKEAGSMSDDEKRGMCYFLFNEKRLNQLLMKQHPKKIRDLVSFWLEQDHDFDRAVKEMNTILTFSEKELNQHFTAYIKGEKKLNVKRAEGSISPYIRFRYLMLLKCAENGDESVAKACSESLKKKNNKLEESVLRIARALIDGDLSKIDRKDFDHSVSFLINSRILLAKRYPAIKSYDVLVAGTEHPYANDRELSVLAVEALTGQKWYENQENERAEWHGKDVRAWWVKHRDSYVFPDQIK